MKDWENQFKKGASSLWDKVKNETSNFNDKSLGRKLLYMAIIHFVLRLVFAGKSKNND